MLDWNNKKAQQSFKTLTTYTDEFTNCFIGQLPLEEQAKKWRKVLTKYLHKSFKRIRIRNKPRIKKTEIDDLISKRKILKAKQNISEKDEEKLAELEAEISDSSQDENHRKVVDNLLDLDGNNGNLNQQGVWKMKKKLFPKVKSSIPVGKKNLKEQLITNPEELKDLYLDTFKFRLRHRKAKPDVELILNRKEELFKLILETFGT